MGNQCFNLGHVIKRNDGGADDLSLFVAFTGDDQNVTGAKVFQRRCNRLAAAADVLRARQIGRTDTRHHRIADGGGVFAARVVVGDDDAVGVACGNRAHLRTLAAVTVSAAAKHHMQFAMAMRADGVQHGFKPVGCMGVINIDSRAVWQRGGKLKSPAHALQTFHRGNRLGAQGQIIG